MNDPLAALRSALDDECGAGPRVAAMATVDHEGTPRVRSVVCRRIGPASIWVASDARSAKNRQVRAVPAVELAFWLPRRREQFRVAGVVAIAGQEDRLAAWAELSDAARALFFWSEPGRAREDSADACSAGVPADQPAPVAFELLALAVGQVEHLELSPHPHRRRRWRAETGWEVEDLNP